MRGSLLRTKETTALICRKGADSALKTFLVWLAALVLLVGVAAASSVEPSIVWLIFQDQEEQRVEVNDFFELLDMGAYVLVPVMPLIERLDLDVQFDRDKQWLLLTHRGSGRTLDIDIAEGVYPGFPQWSEEPPELFEGDFYLAIGSLMYLAEVDIAWSSRRQELVITGPWAVPRAGTDDSVRIPTREEREARVPDVVGPPISLGSIQYAIELGYRESSTEESTLSVGQTLYAHGRLGAWAVSAGASAEFSVLSPDYNYSLPYVRAVNTDNDRMIVLGDHIVSLPNTLGNTKIRGVYVQIPENTSSTLAAFTVVSGPADPGDKVTLFVNGLQISSATIYEGENSYEFNQVSLRIHRINEIVVVKENALGETTSETIQTVASPRILAEGTKESAAFAGLLHNPDSRLWDGQAVGVVMQQAISEDFSFTAETTLVRYGEDAEGYQPIVLSSQMGLAFRLTDSLIGTLDWLVAGEINRLKHGANASLLYALERGFLELQVSHIPVEVAEYTPQLSGQSVTARAGWDFDQEWSMQGQVERSRTIANTDDSEERRTTSAQVTVVNRGSAQRSTSLTGRIVQQELLTAGDENASGVKVNQYSIILDNRRNATNYSSYWKVGATHSRIVAPNGSTSTTNSLQVDNDLFVRLTPQLVLTSGFEGSLSRSGQGETAWDAALTASLRWNVARRTFLTLATKLGIQDEWNGIETELNQVELSLRHLYGTNSWANVGIQYTRTPDSGDQFMTYYAEALHNWAEGRGTLRLDLRYLDPLEGHLQSQLRASGTISWRLPSELEVGLRASRLYSSIYQENPEHQIALFVRQSLAFAPGYISGQSRSRDDRHSAQISGLVFLDMNGNQIRDEGEPLLADIPMHLDGRTQRTDEEGYFHFGNILPGVFAVGLDLRSLPVEYNVVTEERYVQIRENENAHLEFGVTMSGSIAGQVFLDLNANGVMDEGDEPLAWVALRIEALDRTVYTRSNGAFYMEGLPLGQHRIDVVRNTIPHSMVLVGEESFEIEITPENPQIPSIDIPVRYQFTP